MPVLLVISYTCELDLTTSARIRRCSSLVHSLIPWAGNDMFRQLAHHLLPYDSYCRTVQEDVQPCRYPSTSSEAGVLQCFQPLLPNLSTGFSPFFCPYPPLLVSEVCFCPVDGWPCFPCPWAMPQHISTPG